MVIITFQLYFSVLEIAVVFCGLCLSQTEKHARSLKHKHKKQRFARKERAAERVYCVVFGFRSKVVSLVWGCWRHYTDGEKRTDTDSVCFSVFATECKTSFTFLVALQPSRPVCFKSEQYRLNIQSNDQSKCIPLQTECCWGGATYRSSLWEGIRSAAL